MRESILRIQINQPEYICFGIKISLPNVKSLLTFSNLFTKYDSIENNFKKGQYTVNMCLTDC